MEYFASWPWMRLHLCWEVGRQVVSKFLQKWSPNCYWWGKEASRNFPPACVLSLPYPDPHLLSVLLAKTAIRPPSALPCLFTFTSVKLFFWLLPDVQTLAARKGHLQLSALEPMFLSPKYSQDKLGSKYICCWCCLSICISPIKKKKGLVCLVRMGALESPWMRQ